MIPEPKKIISIDGRDCSEMACNARFIVKDKKIIFPETFTFAPLKKIESHYLC